MVSQFILILDENAIYHVKLHNKFYENDVFCKFDIKVSWQGSLPSSLYREQWFSNAMDQKRRTDIIELEKEMEYQKKLAKQTTSMWKWWEKGTEGRNLFSSHNIFGDRPITSFLFMKFQYSNETFWSEMFEYVMMMKKTDLGVSLGTNTLEVFWSLDIFEQMSILEDMCVLPSTNSTYLRDYVLRRNGMLVSSNDEQTMNSDDFSTNINEGGGDCEDMALEIYYMWMTFRLCSKFNNIALETLRRRYSVFNLHVDHFIMKKCWRLHLSIVLLLENQFNQSVT